MESAVLFLEKSPKNRMSKAFTSRPSVRTTGRGQTNARSSTPQRNRGRGSSLNVRGRGGQISSTNSSSRMQNQNNRMYNTPGRGFGGQGQRSYPPQQPRPGAMEAEERQDDNGEQGASSSQTSQYCAGGYTMIEPNARRRQQVNEMAQRETDQYQRYRQQNAVRHCNYVGTTGGGQMTEEEVRRKQANDVRNQKFNRLQNQQRLRDGKKEVEQRQIDARLGEARRKAEQNERRQSSVDAEDIRRKREQFLRRLENQ